MNGQILKNVGFSKVNGNTRQLSIKEQLIQVKNFIGINTIKHPIHGIIDIDKSKVDELLKNEEAHLIRLKKQLFV